MTTMEILSKLPKIFRKSKKSSGLKKTATLHRFDTLGKNP